MKTNVSKVMIVCQGHSCFTVTAGGYTVALDPYAPGSVPGLAPLSLTASLVLCSHDHQDHGYREAVTIEEREKNPFHIYKIDTWHDDACGSLRGTNRIHILETDGIRIAHLGDLGCSLKESQMEQLKKLDALMIPVGGYYTINALQARELVEKLEPRVVIPMHYRSDVFGYPVIGRLEEYTDHCKNVVEYDSSFIEIDANTKPQTAVLKVAGQKNIFPLKH